LQETVPPPQAGGSVTPDDDRGAVRGPAVGSVGRPVADRAQRRSETAKTPKTARIARSGSPSITTKPLSERGRTISRLRWHPHERDPSWEPTARGPDRAGAYDTVEQHPRDHSGSVAWFTRRLDHIRAQSRLEYDEIIGLEIPALPSAGAAGRHILTYGLTQGFRALL
jgi:hypothetical protein